MVAFKNLGKGPFSSTVGTVKKYEKSHLLDGAGSSPAHADIQDRRRHRAGKATRALWMGSGSQVSGGDKVRIVSGMVDGIPSPSSSGRCKFARVTDVNGVIAKMRLRVLRCRCVSRRLGRKRRAGGFSGTGWVDTGVDLQVGDTVQVKASGELQYSNAKQSNGPEGLPRAFTDLIRIMQLNDAGRGALIGRVGTSLVARPFLLGATDRTRPGWRVGCMSPSIRRTAM